MEEVIREVAQNISNIRSGREDFSELTQCAVKIAETALCSFHGVLLDKALNIAKAIVEYEDELKTKG